MKLFRGFPRLLRTLVRASVFGVWASHRGKSPHSKLDLLVRIVSSEMIYSDREKHVCRWFLNYSKFIKSTVMFDNQQMTFEYVCMDFAILLRWHLAGCNSSSQTAEGIILLRSGHQGILADWMTYFDIFCVHPLPWILTANSNLLYDGQDNSRWPLWSW